MIDCSKDVIWSMNAAQLLDSIAAAITRAANSKDAYAEVTRVSDDRDVFRPRRHDVRNVTPAAGNEARVLLDALAFHDPPRRRLSQGDCALRGEPWPNKNKTQALATTPIFQ